MIVEKVVCPFCSNIANVTYEENRVYQLNCVHCHSAIFHQDISWDAAIAFFKSITTIDTDDAENCKNCKHWGNDECEEICFGCGCGTNFDVSMLHGFNPDTFYCSEYKPKEAMNK